MIDACLCRMYGYGNHPEYTIQCSYNRISNATSFFVVIGNVGNQVHVCNAGVSGECCGQALEADHVRTALRLACSHGIQLRFDRNLQNLGVSMASARR